MGIFLLKCMCKIYMLILAFPSDAYDYQRCTYTVNVKTPGMSLLLGLHGREWEGKGEVGRNCIWFENQGCCQ